MIRQTCPALNLNSGAMPPWPSFASLNISYFETDRVFATIEANKSFCPIVLSFVTA
jgi:hypothetical protein